MDRGWSDELHVFTRAFSGAYIFGIPLLFTMEMWWLGEYISTPKLLAFLAVALLANFGLNHVAGFRNEKSFGMNVDEAIDAVVIGIIAATLMLLVLNQLRPSDAPRSVLGMILLQAVPLSIGASVARQIFGGEGGRDGEDNGGHQLDSMRGLLADVGATAIGGVFIGFSIAPTDEIPMISVGLTGGHLLAIIAFSLLVSYAIVFASGFDEASPPGPFQHPFTETVLSYIVSLAISFGLLWLFGQIELSDSPLQIVRQTLVLAVPTTVGGAAGRLVI